MRLACRKKHPAEARHRSWRRVSQQAAMRGKQNVTIPWRDMKVTGRKMTERMPSIA